jgi:hypothetical protein
MPTPSPMPLRYMPLFRLIPFLVRQYNNFEIMTLPSEFSRNSEQILRELSLELTKSNDQGMGKLYKWTNNAMKLGIVYDRGYFECYVLAHKKPFNNLSLIKLLRFLKNDATFYKEELVAANLSYTLPINEYVDLFYKHYDSIKGFLSNYDQEAYDQYNKYEDHYNGI